MGFTLFLVCFIVGYGLYRWVRGRHPGIPGPWGIPVLGYFPWLGRRMNETLTELGKTYGPVFQVQMGQRQMVVVNGQKAIREASSGTKAMDFAGRPDFWSYGLFGVFGATGYPPAQKMYKKMTLRAMGMFANNKRADLDSTAHHAFDMLVDEFKQRNGEPFDSKLVLYDVVWTIMGYICYGRTFNRDDPEVRAILATADEFSKTVVFGVLTDYLPWASILMRSQLERNHKVMVGIEKTATKLAAETSKDWDGKSLRNIADMYRLADKERTEEERNSLQLGESTLLKLKTERVEMLTNLFGAGFATVAVTIKWGLLFVARHPEMQTRLQEELDAVLDGRKYPVLDDEKNLPYTSAFIAETYRASSMASLAMTHMTIRDTELCGFNIPANTPVVLNLYSAHYDETVFPDPHTFNPDRFMQDGQLNKALAEMVMPYGLGPRRCGGELLAKMEIFVFFASILYHAQITPGPGETLDPKNYRFGLGLDPEPFKVSFKARHGLW